MHTFFAEEDKNIIKNIKWLTHGEFTAERGRRQIQLFIAVSQFGGQGQRTIKRPLLDEKFEVQDPRR